LKVFPNATKGVEEEGSLDVEPVIDLAFLGEETGEVAFAEGGVGPDA
jgi:hypothetical protein